MWRMACECFIWTTQFLQKRNQRLEYDRYGCSANLYERGARNNGNVVALKILAWSAGTVRKLCAKDIPLARLRGYV